MKTKTKVLGGLLFAALAIAPRMGATEILTTSYTAWLATVNAGTAEWDFNIPANTYNTASGYKLHVGSYGPVTVTAPVGGDYDLNKNPGYGVHNFLTLAGPADGNGSMNFSLPGTGLTAFYLGLGLTGNVAPITISLSDGEVFTSHPAVGGLAFVGLSSATPITSFVLTSSNGSAVQLADFYAGSSNIAAEAPPADAPAAEVATALMIGTGLALFGGWRKIFSNVSAAAA